MLPKQHRLRRAVDFRTVLRSGRRVRVRYFQMHLLGGTGRPARLGLVVGGKVGNSVQRHRISRQVREGVRPALADFAGHDLVIRALPGAAGLTNVEIRSQIAALVAAGRVSHES